MAIDYTDEKTKYIRSQFDFGGGADDVFAFTGPKGKAGLLWDYGVYDITETFNGDTLDPKISVGKSGDLDYYGDDMTLSTALCAADAGTCSVRTQYAPTDAGFAALMLIDTLTKDVAVHVAMIASTGANLTGIATAFCEVIWAN